MSSDRCHAGGGRASVSGEIILLRTRLVVGRRDRARSGDHA
uniref:Uncharacterized protein n=1 Tax=Rhizobium rhizogenes TaxID=359 RepID=A0A7S4ZRH8_RHIRH|nr:hypothetical protein pC5.7b_430 [Rhizobium rhizogenes]